MPDALATFGKITQKTLAFTLAETLIVMGVIGIVSALTLPNLNSSTGDKERVVALKKIYSDLTDAFDRAQAVYGPYDEWFTDIQGVSNFVNRTNRMADRITEFMKIQKKCPIGTSGCFSTGKMLTFTGQVHEENDSLGSSSYNALRFILSDGTSIAFLPNNVSFLSTADYVGFIMVDIDGPNKGKNQDGYDRFTFAISHDLTIVPGGSYYCSTQGNFDYTNADYSLASWVLLNGNMDYFKCNDLNWQTKTSCK